MGLRIGLIVLFSLAVGSLVACSTNRHQTVLIDPVYHPDSKPAPSHDVAVAKVDDDVEP